MCEDQRTNGSNLPPGAVCIDCNKNMLGEGRAGCTRKLVDGKPRIPSAEPGNCHDCGVAPGTIHHLGCDSEICPTCGKHLLIDEKHNPDFAG